MQICRATEQDYDQVEKLVIDSFDPVTWARPLEQTFGPLNGLDWQARWKIRMRKIFAEQIVLLGVVDGVLTAVSSCTLEQASALAYIDIVAVARQQQGHGYGREMLRATIQHLQQLGAQYVNLDCLTDNDKGNALYQGEGFVEVARHIRWFRRI